MRDEGTLNASAAQRQLFQATHILTCGSGSLSLAPTAFPNTDSSQRRVLRGKHPPNKISSDLHLDVRKQDRLQRHERLGRRPLLDLLNVLPRQSERDLAAEVVRVESQQIG